MTYHPSLAMIHYPRVHIEFCTKCKWNLRAAWYSQELLSTFGPDLGEVAMAPADAGVFKVWIQVSADTEDVLLWDRKTAGFPDSKDLKQLVRDAIDPSRDLGHSDKKDIKAPATGANTASATTPSATTPSATTTSATTREGDRCEDCERNE